MQVKCHKPGLRTVLAHRGHAGRILIPDEKPMPIRPLERLLGVKSHPSSHQNRCNRTEGSKENRGDWIRNRMENRRYDEGLDLRNG